MRLVLALAVAVLLSAAALPAVGQGRPDCATVMRQLHRISGHDGAGTPDASAVAEKLHVDERWVVRCANSYGRRVKQRPAKAREGDEGLSPRQEAREYEEVAREEREFLENRAQGDPDEYKNRDRVRGIDPDSSAEWEPYLTHEWTPNTGHVWRPYLLDDDSDEE
ncbi:MAG: hypothetical protein ACRERC_00205 [Candidatus Binatia bacterium]